MTLPNQISTREFEAFDEINGLSAKRVSLAGGAGIMSGVVYDYVSYSEPTTSTEQYIFKNGGSGGTTQATITITYTDSSKATLSSVEKT